MSGIRADDFLLDVYVSPADVEAACRFASQVVPACELADVVAMLGGVTP